ncbi:uncharacterized protein LOC107883167 isoform X1 [Acyrthosiphon pisum]|uniref:Cuticle protein 6 n=1 Tax=Acyrthosiphon pisum TaxID=7029 RepID=A0A8R2H587_ACYPI|nr:uncharacterized protein LOC107883167 isoform X1 [Acyrthosiphon pisum]|eukprot:XP_016658199.1 PREDICTED: uncharacterized protein LOC107883167 isoform X1 [Acyrthosiphon pisum]
MMHLSSAIAVLMIVVAAASAGLYPATMGNKGAAVGRTKSTANRDTSGDSYHMQSSDGQYVFGHTNGEQGRAEMRDSDGTVTGYYSYADRDGRVVRVDYVADKGGYRVISNAGVQSASVTVQADGGGAAPAAQSDFRKLYTDMTRRIKSTVVQRGQKVVDPIGEGQQPVVVDPIPYPTEETKHSNPEEKINFPDWSQVKISTTQKPTNGIEKSEGQQQQQQETVDPNLDSVKITTQKSNIKGNENDGQESIDDSKSGMITTDIPSVPLVPIQPQVPTKGDHKGEYSDTVYHEDQAKEITTEVGNSMIGAESTVIDDTENNSPVTKPISIISNVQTTVSYYDRPGQTTESTVSSDGRLGFQTTISGVKQFDEYSTAVVSESATEHYRTIKENEDKIKISSETDVLVTIKPLQDNESFENVQTTVEPNRQTDVQTTGVLSSVDSTTIETVNGNPALVSTVRPLYESDITTSQTGGRVGDTETATAVDAAGIQYVTEQNNNNEDRPEFRTLEPTESIGTTIRPDLGNSQQELQEIVWPEIPQESVPQVLVPLDPYPAEDLRPKNVGVKTQPNDSRPVRDYKPDELKSAINVSEIETTTMIISNDEENGAMFNFPKYYLIG